MELLTGDFLKWIFKDQAEFPYFQEYMKNSLQLVPPLPKQFDTYKMIKKEREKKWAFIKWWSYKPVLAVDSAVAT